MTNKTIVAFMGLKYGGSSLVDFLDNTKGILDNDLGSLNVLDSEGNHLTGAYLQEEVLTDGSKVYNLILTTDKG